MNKWVKMMTDEGIINLTDLREGLMYLDFKEEDVETVTNFTDIQGVDGSLPSASTFAPFKLVLRFVYSGQDIADYHMVKQRLRETLYRRTPFYIVHSDMPGKKYAVITESTAVEDLYGRNGEFEITFNVFKGYSESLMTTDEFDLSSDYWQFGNGLVADDDVSYVHTKRKFKIFNGSSDTVTPIHRHHLIITMNVKAPNGFTLHNKTTGDKFEYKKAIKNTDTITLNGVYPFKNKKRCGIDTNWEYITLAPGYNDFEVLGDGVETKEIKFTFNYVYR